MTLGTGRPPRWLLMREAHAEDRVWGQEVPRQRHRLTGYQAQGSYMLQTASKALQMHRGGPGPGVLRFSEEQGPLSRAMNHPVGESKQAPPDGKRAGRVQRLGGGGGSGPSISRPLAAALRPTCLPGPRWSKGICFPNGTSCLHSILEGVGKQRKCVVCVCVKEREMETRMMSEVDRHACSRRREAGAMPRWT